MDVAKEITMVETHVTYEQMRKVMAHQEEMLYRANEAGFVMQVDDAEGVHPGDNARIECADGSSREVRIIGVDYDNKTVTYNFPLAESTDVTIDYQPKPRLPNRRERRARAAQQRRQTNGKKR